MYIMKKFVVAVLFASLVVSVASAPVFAAPKPTKTVEVVGYDVSYPQCGKTLPVNPVFTVVGVNGGRPGDTNPCLEQQLTWARTANGGAGQPAIQMYVNTANPGAITPKVTSWPTNNYDPQGNETAGPYGACDGANTQACSWQYGWNKASETYFAFFLPHAKTAGIPAGINDYVWWLDVELENTWQSGSSEALQRNTATLEGMTSFFQKYNAKGVGIYATMSQWTTVTGGKNAISETSVLNKLPDWRPSGTSLAIATSNCTEAEPLTRGGYVSMTQYVVRGFDRNHSCAQ